MAASRKSVADGVLYFLNALLAIALLFAYPAPYLDPEITAFFEFFALLYPLLLLANILFAVYWLLRLKIKIALPVVVIALGYPHLATTYQIEGKNKVTHARQTLKVMTFNVRLFNAYRWIDREGVAGEIKSYIQSEKPDILLVQEYLDRTAPEELGFAHVMHQPLNKEANWGLAVYSRFPLQEVALPHSTVTTRAMAVDVDWQGRTLRIFNAHLQSIGLDSKDYQQMATPQDKTLDELKQGAQKIGARVSMAAKKRAAQAEQLQDWIAASPYPVIMGGDLNAVPYSYVYHLFSQNLNDAFLGAGLGLSLTYEHWPMYYRIDYLMASEGLRASSYHTGPKNLSDHRPVLVKYEWEGLTN